MRSLLIIAIMAVLVLASSPAMGFPVTITQVVKDGDNVAGVGPISSGFGASERFAVNNSGQWFVEADTTNADANIDGVLLSGTGHGAFSLYQQEGSALPSPAGASLGSWDSIRLNNLGNASFNNFLDGLTSTTDSGIYFNGDLLIQESNFTTAPGFSASVPYTGWFETHVNDSNNVLMISSLNDPALGTTSTDRAIISINPFSLTETTIVKEGDELLPGRFFDDCGTDSHDSAWNNNGYALYSADLTGATTDDGLVVYSNGVSTTILAQESFPVPGVAGRNWGSISGASLDVNDNGDWVIIGDMDGATTDDLAILRNGTDVLAREGSSLAAIGGVFTFTSFGSGGVLIDHTGDVVWYGDWNDGDTTRDTGIFLNDKLIVQEGVTTVGGLLVTAISGVTDNLAMSDDGHWIMFEGTLDGTIEGAFIIEVPEPATCALLLVPGMLLLKRRRR